jgi:thiol-disulfide isomerase/thioredoxin
MIGTPEAFFSAFGVSRNGFLSSYANNWGKNRQMVAVANLARPRSSGGERPMKAGNAAQSEPRFFLFSLPQNFNPLMSLRLFCLLAAFALAAPAGFAQDGKAATVPAVPVKKLDGSAFSTADLSNDGKPIILSFWATWCKPCILELNAIAERYADWQAETGVKLVAVSIDDGRTTHAVAPFVNGKGWDYEVYLDPNGDLKRAMNVNLVPHTFLLNGNKEIVNQHTTYSPGDEDLLYEKVKLTAAGQPVHD